MAHLNIEERRIAVAALLKSKNATTKEFKAIAEFFNCSYSAILSDKTFLKSKYKYTVFPSRKVKLSILERDKYTCQYCGKQNCKLIVDHVIPYLLGGVGYEYNLVVACASCNSRKGKNGRVWIPNNIDILEALNPEWHQKIIDYFNS